MTTTKTQCDPRALRIALDLHQKVRPYISILFGSRARGDYEDGRSDIDIMLVVDALPPQQKQNAAAKMARTRAKGIYGDYVPIQVIWQTMEEFDRMRRTMNHVTVHALGEGILMSDDPAYDGRNFENEEEDYSYEWTITEERLRHAERHLAAFNLMIDGGMHDSMIGQHAQGAMEHALKALISARVERYPHVHSINDLLTRARRVDRRFQFTPEIPGNIYNQYVGRDEYGPTKHPITDIEDYRNKVNSDVGTVLARIQEIRRAGLTKLTQVDTPQPQS